MGNSALKQLYDVVLSRKNTPVDNSYTCYLFREGLNKILKKCGEECAETIIAAKDGNVEDTKNEICDLMYHILVLMTELDISFESVECILNQRALKIGNLKQIKDADRLS